MERFLQQCKQAVFRTQFSFRSTTPFVQMPLGGYVPPVVGYLEKFTSLARYAPEDTDTEEKKMDRFLDGLHEEMQCVLVALDFADLDSLVDKAIMMEEKRRMADESRKRRMFAQGGPSNQKPRNFQPVPPRPAPQPQRALVQISRPSNFINRPNRPNFNQRPGGGNGNFNSNPADRAANVTCFKCGTKGHYSNSCPNRDNAVQRPNAPRPNPGQGRGNPGRNPAPRNPPAANRGRLNHVNAEEAQEAPDIVLGMFLVNSTHAKVLFDSGASHSFVTKSFALKSGMVATQMVKPMIVQTPGES